MLDPGAVDHIDRISFPSALAFFGHPRSRACFPGLLHAVEPHAQPSAVHSYTGWTRHPRRAYSTAAVTIESSAAMVESGAVTRADRREPPEPVRTSGQARGPTQERKGVLTSAGRCRPTRRSPGTDGRSRWTPRRASSDAGAWGTTADGHPSAENMGSSSRAPPHRPDGPALVECATCSEPVAL